MHECDNVFGFGRSREEGGTGGKNHCKWWSIAWFLLGEVPQSVGALTSAPKDFVAFVDDGDEVARKDGDTSSVTELADGNEGSRG